MENAKVHYVATGLVYGKYWGGGCGAYGATHQEADTLEELEQKINNGIRGGSLDAGMGFESLGGALMNIDTISEILIDGKVFRNVESEFQYFGKLKEEEEEFLLEVYYNS